METRKLDCKPKHHGGLLMAIDARLLTGSDIANLARFLHERGEDFQTILYMLEKPWKYEPEAQHMRNCPTPAPKAANCDLCDHELED